MIERKFVTEKIKEFQIQRYARKSLRNVGLSHIRVQRTPLGEKIVVYSSRPGLVVGRKGQNIKQLTKMLKKEFELENPQIEISEVENTSLNATIMAEKIADYLEKFGTKNFKGIGHKIMTEVMGGGALGVEIILSGKIPSSRAKSWRFYSGYLRKCGDISLEMVEKSYAAAQLKSGVVGIKISIMPPDIKLPDDIQLVEQKEEIVEEIKEGEEEKKKGSKGKDKKKEKEEKKKDTKKDDKKATKEKPKEEVKEKDEAKGNKVDE